MNLRQGCSPPKVIHRNVTRDRIPGVVNAYEQQQKRRPVTANTVSPRSFRTRFPTQREI